MKWVYLHFGSCMHHFDLEFVLDLFLFYKSMCSVSINVMKRPVKRNS